MPFKNFLTQKLNGNSHYKVLCNQVVKRIEFYQKFSDTDLKAQTILFKREIKKGRSLNDLLVSAFAVVCEADKRVLGMSPYDVQILGGIALHFGSLAQMETGEGKTLTATMPVYLNALTGKGVHIFTVNDYLSHRDYLDMGKVYQWLGLTVGYVNSEMSVEDKCLGYSSDVTFSTSETVGFDYLFDNLAMSTSEQVHPRFNFAIVDEADSVLIDAAASPLIVAGEPHGIGADYNEADLFVSTLTDSDYNVDDEDKIANLTQSGIQKAERWYDVTNLYAEKNFSHLHYLQLALNARFVFIKDKDYTVNRGEVVLINQGTGRVDEGSRLEYGQHQALEAKEHVMVQDESNTDSSITYQSLFRMYRKLAGMTGTGLDVREELLEMYGMPVVVIPPHKKRIRTDHPDEQFQTKRRKLESLLKLVQKVHQTGRPILLTSDSVRNSELLDRLLFKMRLPHQLLNVHNAYQEADIIKTAGQLGSILVATGMAGRGTDIKLGKGVRELGGLYVIGSERYENSRVDKQLRGRAGRQGDPGDSIFFTSLEDDLLISNTSEKLANYLDKHQLDGQAKLPLTKHAASFMRSAIDDAQARVTGQKYSQRLEGFKYDDLIQPQRALIYQDRQFILSGGKNNLKDFIKNCSLLDETFSKSVKNSLKKAGSKKMTAGQWQGLFQKWVLTSIDDNWAKHLDFAEQLKTFVSIRSYAQLNPIFEYHDDIRNSFVQLQHQIVTDIHTKLIEFCQEP